VTDELAPVEPTAAGSEEHVAAGWGETIAARAGRPGAAGPGESIAAGAGEAIPHWPGELVSLGGYQVYVRSTSPDIPPPVSPDSDNTKLEYPEGNGSAHEPALCVHGLAGSSRNWTDLMDLLRPGLACDALDLPGFGDSPPRPDGRYSIAAFAQTVIELIERRGPKYRGPVHLIGNSLGGAVCVKAAAARPELVRTLTLISPALPDSRPRLDLLQFPVMCLPRVGTRLLRRYQALPPENRVADVIANCYSNPALFSRARYAAEVAELSRRDSLGYATAALVGSIRALTAETLRIGRHSAWRDAARITTPSLVVYGSDDRVVDPRMAGRAARAFSDARIVVLPHTGHVAHMEHPDVVAAEIRALLAAASQGAARRTREFPLAPAG
jgi:pimeloyl-ACP methyl ester carboxylesterase